MENYAELIGMFVNFGLPILILIFAYFVGSRIEKKHFEDIRRREADARNFPVVSFHTMPEDWNVGSSKLVSGNIVVSLDYFKRVIIKTYEPLLDRARREAMLRMIESARSQGYDAVINVRLETSRLANARRDGRGIAGVEMFAYGTALKFASRFANSQ